jgi:hypothetical protein
MRTFSAETYQNEYLPVGGSEVNAVVTVTASGDLDPTSVGDAAEIVVIDVSGSMAGRKIRAAQEATVAAIECIRDGVAFGVIAGKEDARAVHPQNGALVPASESARSEAARAVRQLDAEGGTAIGSWLRLANDLFAGSPDAIHHAILLTDGKNEGETEAELTRALEACAGGFQCDCRGVGTDWEVAELRRIASALLGTVDIVADPSGLEADFRSVIEDAMGKRTGDVALRLWTPQGAEIGFVKQVSPTIEDLGGHAHVRDARTSDYPIGAWGAESRDYHLSIRVPPREVGDEMLAGRVGLLVGDDVVGQTLIRAIWTDDEGLSTHLNPEVAHYTGQVELADVIQDGLEARREGDEHTATIKLGRAVQLAAESGNDATMQLLQQVVEVDDAATGTVRLKSQVEDAEEMALDTRSTRSVRVQR